VSDAYRVELRTVDGGPTAVASSGPFSVLADRPVAGGGRGLGFNGGQLLYAAIAACYSNDLYREAASLGLMLRRVALTVDGDFPARGEPSTPITIDVELDGDASWYRLKELVELVDRVAEIPNSIRGATPVDIREVRITGADSSSTTRYSSEEGR
jgi:putative redox protein